MSSYGLVYMLYYFVTYRLIEMGRGELAKFLGEAELPWEDIHGEQSLKQAGLTMKIHEHPVEMVVCNLASATIPPELQSLSRLVKKVVKSAVKGEKVQVLQVMRKKPGTTQQRNHIDVSPSVCKKIIEAGSQLPNMIVPVSNGWIEPRVYVGGSIDFVSNTFRDGEWTGGNMMQLGSIFKFNGCDPHHGMGNDTQQTLYSIFVSLSNKMNATMEMVTFLQWSNSAQKRKRCSQEVSFCSIAVKYYYINLLLFLFFELCFNY